MQIIKVRNIEDEVIEDWTIDQILNEINRDRSGDWTDYDESDWREGWNEWVEGEFYSLIDEDGKLLTADESIEGQIIAVARDIMKTDFMQYPDFDPSTPTYLCDALTIIVSQHLEDVGSHEIYDLLKKQIK